MNLMKITTTWKNSKWSEWASKYGTGLVVGVVLSLLLSLIMRGSVATPDPRIIAHDPFMPSEFFVLFSFAGAVLISLMFGIGFGVHAREQQTRYVESEQRTELTPVQVEAGGSLAAGEASEWGTGFIAAFNTSWFTVAFVVLLSAGAAPYFVTDTESLIFSGAFGALIFACMAVISFAFGVCVMAVLDKIAREILREIPVVLRGELG